jgi:DNA-binding transcriptional regulator YiaG
MTAEGKEHRSDKREARENDEKAERRVREMIDEARRRTEARRESGEKSEHRAEGEESRTESEGSEFERKMRETIDEARERTERRRAESKKVVRDMVDEARQRTEARRERDTHPDECSNAAGGETEQSVRDAVREIEEMEAEREAARERYEQELRKREENRELNRIHREDEADKDRLSKFEEELAERLEEYDIDPGELRERWRGRYVDDIEDELGNKSEEDESGEDREQREDEGEIRPNEGVSYHADSSGQVYAVKLEGREDSGSEAECEQEGLDFAQEQGEQPSTSVDNASEEPERTEPAETDEETQKYGKVREIELEEEEQSDFQEEAEQDNNEPSERPTSERNSEPSSPTGELTEEGKPQKSPETTESETDEENHSETRSEPERPNTERVREDASSEESTEEDGESEGEELGGAWRFKRASIFGDKETEVTEEDLKRFRREQFHKLPDEEKEKFREMLRNLVKTLEDAERLAHKHGREDLLEGDARQRIQEYLRIKAMCEESEDEEPHVDEPAGVTGADPGQIRKEMEEEPEELKELLNIEGEWRWQEILRVCVENMYLESEEELKRVTEDNPEIRQMEGFEAEWKRVETWTEIINLRHRGDIEMIVRDGREFYSIEEILRLSAEYDVSEGEILSWLKGTEIPILFSLVHSPRPSSKEMLREIGVGGKLQAATSISNTEVKPKSDEGMLSEKENQQALEEDIRDNSVIREQHVKHSAVGELDPEEVHRLYYDEGLSQRKVAEVLGCSRYVIQKLFANQGWQSRTKREAAKLNIDPQEVYRICVEEGRPKKEAAKILGCGSIRPVNRILNENDWKTPLEIKLETEIDPDEVHRLHYDEGWSLKKIANHYGYRSKCVMRKLFKERDWIPVGLARQLDRRYKFAPDIEDEHRIEPSSLVEAFGHLRETKAISSSDVARCIGDILSSSPVGSRVRWIEMDSEEDTSITEVLENRRLEVESLLNELPAISDDTEEKVRVGYVDGKLYIRRQDLSEYNWMNIYENELLYFESVDEKFRLVHEMRARLGLSTNTDLGRLIDQLTDRDVEGGDGYCDIREHNEHLRAETLHLILDTTGESLQDIQERIHCIGKICGGEYEGIGGIRNPRFPDDHETIDIMFAKFFGLGLSDGHIGRLSPQFTYVEKDPERCQIVIEHSKDFGDVHYLKTRLENGVSKIVFACAFGRVMEGRGFPVGDKIMQNCGLAPFIRHGSLRIICAYFKNAWPEDGCFSIEHNDNRGIFVLQRSVALKDPTKEKEYHLESEVTDDHLALIREYGIRIEEDSGNRMGERIILTVGELESLIKSASSDISAVASSLRDVIYANESRLLRDEFDALASVGIEGSIDLCHAVFHVESSRLSASWKGRIRRMKDVMRTALLMPPDDVRKKALVDEWVQLHPKLRRQVERELGKLGPKSARPET